MADLSEQPHLTGIKKIKNWADEKPHEVVLAFVCVVGVAGTLLQSFYAVSDHSSKSKPYIAEDRRAVPHTNVAVPPHEPPAVVVAPSAETPLRETNAHHVLPSALDGSMPRIQDLTNRLQTLNEEDRPGVLSNELPNLSKKSELSIGNVLTFLDGVTTDIFREKIIEEAAPFMHQPIGPADAAQLLVGLKGLAYIDTLYAVKDCIAALPPAAKAEFVAFADFGLRSETNAALQQQNPGTCKRRCRGDQN